MRVLAGERAARHLELEDGRAQVHGRRELHGEVEPAEAAEADLALADLVPLGVAERPRERRGGGGRGLDVAAGTGRDPPHPALDAHLLAGPVHLPVVEREEAQHVAAGRLPPARALAPPAGRGGQDRDVLAAAGHQEGSRSVAEGEAGQAGGVRARGRGGPPRPRRAGMTERQVDVREGTAVGEVARPREERLLVGERVEADPGRLHPRRDGLAPAIPRGCGRLHHEDHLADAVLEGRGEVDPRLGEGVGLAARANRGVDDAPARRCRPPLVAPPSLTVRVPGRPVLGSHRVDLDVQRLVVDRQHREGTSARGIEDHEVPARREQSRRSVSHREGERLPGLERLAEGVPDPVRERHAVRRAATWGAADRERVAPRLHLEPRQLRLDAHEVLAERLRVDRVGELDPPGIEGRAAAAPAALVAAHAEGAVGAEAPVLGRRRASRSLRGRRAGGHPYRHRGVGRQLALGPEGHDAPGLRRLHEARAGLVGRHLVRGGEAHGDGAPARDHARRGQDGGGVDGLVEDGQKQRVAARRAALRVPGQEARRRGRERPGHVRGQRAAGDAARAGRYLDAVVGRHREAAHRLEHERARADPAPLAGRLRGESHGDRLAREVGVRVEGDHGLRERDREVRGERHVALGHAPHDLQGARRAGVRVLRLLLGRERRERGAPRAGRRQRALAEGERLLARKGREWRQAIEHAACLGIGEPLRLRSRDERGRLALLRALAEAEDEPRGGAGGGGRRRTAGLEARPSHRLARLPAPIGDAERRRGGEEQPDDDRSRAQHRPASISRGGYRRTWVPIPPLRDMMGFVPQRRRFDG